MKLYSNKFAPSPRRVRMYAAEKGIPLEVVEIDIGAGEAQTPGYRAINPLGETPALVRDDGSVLVESLAICRWLEEEHPEPNLYGRTARERADINAWIDRLMFQLYVPTADAFRHTHPYWATRIEQNAAWGEAARARVRAEYAALDAALGEREFLARDAFSMADIVLYTTIDFGKPAKLRLDEGESKLKRWYEAVGARPSARA